MRRLVVLISVGLCASAQEAVIRSDARLVQVNVVVRDRRGPVGGNEG